MPKYLGYSLLYLFQIHSPIIHFVLIPRAIRQEKILSSYFLSESINKLQIWMSENEEIIHLFQWLIQKLLTIVFQLLLVLVTTPSPYLFRYRVVQLDVTTSQLLYIPYWFLLTLPTPQKMIPLVYPF